MTHITEIVDLCLSQDGDRYVFGAEAAPSDTDPDAFDCSELIQWACGRAGLVPVMPDGSWIQARHCKNHATMISVSAGIAQYGALLFRFVGDPFTGGRPSAAHVAMSLGDGTTIEARSSRYGVGVFTATGRGWTHAAIIPGADYTDQDIDDDETGDDMGFTDWANGMFDLMHDDEIVALYQAGFIQGDPDDYFDYYTTLRDLGSEGRDPVQRKQVARFIQTSIVSAWLNTDRRS